MQATADDGLWKARKRSGQFWIHQLIPTWNQDTYHETWKAINNIIETNEFLLFNRTCLNERLLSH